jgi:hypothetical protein
MFDWKLLYHDALIYGLILSFALTIFMVISGAIALDAFVNDYPPDIKQKSGPHANRIS